MFAEDYSPFTLFISPSRSLGIVRLNNFLMGVYLTYTVSPYSSWIIIQQQMDPMQVYGGFSWFNSLLFSTLLSKFQPPQPPEFQCLSPVLSCIVVQEIPLVRKPE